ncbi:MAG: DUF6133 family protein [Clostridia bacterium]|nr:DUF6133 family protein [Clostridia bacterium]
MTFIKNVNKKISNGLTKAYIKSKNALANIKGEMYVDKSVGIIIAVVVGALILTGVYALVKEVMTTMDSTVIDMFDYAA